VLQNNQTVNAFIGRDVITGCD